MASTATKYIAFCCNTTLRRRSQRDTSTSRFSDPEVRDGDPGGPPYLDLYLSHPREPRLSGSSSTPNGLIRLVVFLDRVIDKQYFIAAPGKPHT